MKQSLFWNGVKVELMWVRGNNRKLEIKPQGINDLVR